MFIVNVDTWKGKIYRSCCGALRKIDYNSLFFCSVGVYLILFEITWRSFIAILKRCVPIWISVIISRVLGVKPKASTCCYRCRSTFNRNNRFVKVEFVLIDVWLNSSQIFWDIKLINFKCIPTQNVWTHEVKVFLLTQLESLSPEVSRVCDVKGPNQTESEEIHFIVEHNESSMKVLIWYNKKFSCFSLIKDSKVVCFI